MPTSSTTRKLPIPPIVIGVVVVTALLAGMFYLQRPALKSPESQASAEAKSYLRNLELKDVTMQASENFMKQQVVEVQGAIANNGPRPLRLIEVYCLFYGIDGHELHRERVSVVSATAAPLKPGETRRFRLPFDNLPGGWNQALPNMVIAQLGFAS